MSVTYILLSSDFTLYLEGQCQGAVAWSDLHPQPGGWLRFDPQVRQNSFMEFGHEIISTAILSLPLIQEGQLSVIGERMCTKYW